MCGTQLLVDGNELVFQFLIVFNLVLQEVIELTGLGNFLFFLLSQLKYLLLEAVQFGLEPRYLGYVMMLFDVFFELLNFLMKK